MSSNQIVCIKCSECGKRVFFGSNTIKEDDIPVCPDCAVKDTSGRVIVIGKIELSGEEVCE